MILYLDTSALVKLYVSEKNSDTVTAFFQSAKVAATSLVAHVETLSALNRMKRERRLTAAQADKAKKSFEKDWVDYLVVKMDATLMKRAGQLVESFPLKAYDAIHLASAERLLHRAKSTVTFACFDKQLNAAARALGFEIC